MITYICNVKSPEKIGTQKIMGLHSYPVENQSIRTKVNLNEDSHSLKVKREKCNPDDNLFKWCSGMNVFPQTLTPVELDGAFWEVIRFR